MRAISHILIVIEIVSLVWGLAPMAALVPPGVDREIENTQKSEEQQYNYPRPVFPYLLQASGDFRHVHNHY